MASQTGSNGLDLNAAVIALFQVPDTLYRAWEEHVPQTAQDTLSKASEASGVPKKYLLWIVLTLGFYVLTGRAGDICYRVVATLYPGYMSFTALESSNKERSTRWLKYWVIHAVIEFVCFFTPSFIDRLASISMMKTIFVLWCILPIKPSGTDIVYEHLGGVSEKVRQLAIESVKLLSEDSHAGAASDVTEARLGRAESDRGSRAHRARSKRSACGDESAHKVRELRLRHLQGRKSPKQDPETPPTAKMRSRRDLKNHSQDSPEDILQKDDSPEPSPERSWSTEPDAPEELATSAIEIAEPELPEDLDLIESPREESRGKPSSGNEEIRSENLFEQLSASAKVEKDTEADSRNGRTPPEDRLAAERRLAVLKRADSKVLAFIDEKRASRYRK